jgi:hypothetical protein
MTMKAENKIAQKGRRGSKLSFSFLRVMGEYDIYHVWHMTAISTKWSCAGAIILITNERRECKL